MRCFALVQIYPCVRYVASCFVSLSRSEWPGPQRNTMLRALWLVRHFVDKSGITEFAELDSLMFQVSGVSIKDIPDAVPTPPIIKVDLSTDADASANTRSPSAGRKRSRNPSADPPAASAAAPSAIPPARLADVSSAAPSA
eukprot:161963-Pleurochrysis_carterae.AAC.2